MFDLKVSTQYVPRASGGRPYPVAGLCDTNAIQGKAKHKAWQKEVDAGTSKSSAEQKYVTLVNKLKDTYGYDPNKPAEAVGGS